MKRLILTLLLLSVTHYACGSRSVESKVAKKIDDSCKATAPCIIYIKDITDFEWDKMYVFKYNATLEQIQQALGMFLPEKTQFTRKIVFLRDSKVIYSEELPTNVEHIVNGEVIFDIPDNAVYKMYSFNDAVFIAEKKDFIQGVYYNLKQVKR